MYVIVGLGNKGEKYERTRHNAGRMAVSAFVGSRGGSCVASGKYAGCIWEGALGEESILALLPETFMNESGGSVKKVVKNTADAERLIVVYDDIDLALGTLRISFDRGAGGHNGVRSVIDAVRTEKFIRIRVGISKEVAGKVKKPSSAEGVLKFVMGEWKKPEEKVLEEVFGKVGDAIVHIVEKGVTSAMNKFN